MRTILPPFEPDKSLFDSTASANVINVVPTPNGWGPMLSLVPFTDAAPERPLAVYSARTAEGVQVAFIFTATAIYKVETDGSLTDVSFGTYSASEWSVDIFGNRIIATNITNGPKYWDIGTSTTFMSLPGSPPKARFVRTIGDFVFLFQTENSPSGMAWSGINDSGSWTAGEELSDTQTFPDGEEIQSCVVTGSGAIWGYRQGWRTMSYDVSTGWVFTFTPYAKGKGVASARSLVDIGRGDFLYYSDQGFMRGMEGQPIGAGRVDEWFKTVCSQANRRMMVGYSDPFSKSVLWRFEDSGSVGRLLGYNWAYDRWFYISEPVDMIGLFAASGYSLEDLDAIYGSIDDVPFSLDSEQFAGGFPGMAGVDSDYKLGFFAGSTLEATIGTNQFELNPGARAFVNEVRLISDAPSKTLEISTAGDFHETDTVGPTLSPSSRGGVFRPRSEGRLHRFTFSIPAGTQWASAVGLDIQFTGAGKL